MFELLQQYEFQILGIVSWYYRTVLLPCAVISIFLAIIQAVTSPSSKIRFIVCYLLYLIWTTTGCLFLWPFFLINATGTKNCMYGAMLLKYAAKWIGIEYELRRGELLKYETGAAVIVANHQSFFDVLGMFTKWHIMQKCTAIARKKVFWIWPFGLTAWLAGVVFIDRTPSYSKTHEKVNKAAEYIRKQNAKLWIFVEGTRNSRPEKLLPFKKGAFHVAISSQLPIIPVVYSPYYFINGKSLYFGRGKIIMEVLEPISTKGLTLNDMDDLMAKVYEVMSEKNDELRAEMKKLKELGQLPDCCNL